MPSYKDWLNIENPNSLSERDLRTAIRLMSSAANKRLRRLEESDIPYGEETGENTIAGVRRFSGKGKTFEGLRAEFKRVRNFLMAQGSSLRGMQAQYRKFLGKLEKKSRQEFEKMFRQKGARGAGISRYKDRWEQLRGWRKLWRVYNRLVEEGIYVPSSLDSNQIQTNIYYQVERNPYASESDIYETMLSLLKADYEASQEQVVEQEERDISTSSLIGGPSD